MSDKDGGPAFPSSNEVRIGEWVSDGHRGMTLRDWFAGQALAGLLASTRRYDSYADYAGASYKYADAMLAESGKVQHD